MDLFGILEKKKNSVDLEQYKYPLGESLKDTDWSGKKAPDTISDLNFNGVVILKNTTTDSKTIKLGHCFFSYINIKDQNSSNIGKFTFEMCKVEKGRLYNCSAQLKIRDCNINTLILDGQSDISKIKIEKSNIGSIILQKDTRVGKISITNESVIKNIDCRDGLIEDMNINDSKVGYVRINNSIGNLALDNGAVLSRFSIEKEDSFKSFIKLMDEKRRAKAGGTLSEKIAEAQRQNSIFQAALSQYESDHRFEESDLCLVYLRHIGCAIKRMESKHIASKIYYAFKGVIFEKVFGWGVRITNVLVSSLVLIMLFSLIYLFDTSLSWDFVQCLKTSVVNFFNINITMPPTTTEIADICLVEEIIGIVMITITTGVIVRKIIR